jgi:hypothetical protein
VFEKDTAQYASADARGEPANLLTVLLLLLPQLATALLFSRLDNESFIQPDRQIPESAQNHREKVERSQKEQDVDPGETEKNGVGCHRHSFLIGQGNS